jgi:hypothetical protein
MNFASFEPYSSFACIIRNVGHQGPISWSVARLVTTIYNNQPFSVLMCLDTIMGSDNPALKKLDDFTLITTASELVVVSSTIFSTSVYKCIALSKIKKKISIHYCY